MASARPFRAFVSYSHADAAFAAWLQRKLEGYRLPRRLAGQVEPLPGQSPGRIGPVFRDRPDLSAAQDLSAAVREAIALSSALVVVASPDAARSQWVAREIDLFRELHPDAPVLVALVRGDSADAVPEPLRAGGAHPLAADFRKQGDGKRLAFLKIVAGLADLPLDALVQRDAQRQVRRVTAVTLGAIGLVLIMALLLILALRAREEAERRRVGAEGVIEAMLTDVRPEARRGGNLKLRAAINQLALDYYSRQGDLSDLPDESIERRARVLHAIGEDDATLGNYQAAQARFDEAHEATARILARRPADPDALFAHAQSEYWIGSVAFSSNDQDRALKHWRNYLDRAQDLSHVEPRTVRSLLELGHAHGNLCDVNMRDKLNVTAGLDHCRKALEYDRAALALKPRDEEILKTLANRLGWFADALMTRERFAEARTHREAEAAIMALLLKANDEDVELRDRAIWPQIGLGKIDIAEGELDRGLARYRDCLRDLDRLAFKFPDNQLVLGERIRVNVLAAAALREAGRNEWRAYRNRAEALLYGGPPGTSRERRPPPALKRQHEMFVRLEQGDRK
jgi:tetratricopeptide (TPR) repeat protein